MLGEALGVELLDGVADDAVQGSAALLEHALVGHVVGEGVLEGELPLGEEVRLIEELRGLKCRKALLKLFL